MEKEILDSAECIKNSAEYMYHFSDLMDKSEKIKTLKDIQCHISNILKITEEYIKEI